MPGATKMPDRAGQRNALYLFVCHLEWHDRRNVSAYQELLAALDDPDASIRVVAEVLLRRSSPRPVPGEIGVDSLVSKDWG
ncbi:MAG: hypothetical protein WCF22_15700 [Candidatus Sulfotelmatobacter sp.]